MNKLIATFLLASASMVVQPVSAAPTGSRAALTQSGNELLYCVSREVGMNMIGVRHQFSNREDMVSKGASLLTVVAIASCSNYYQAMARNMGLSVYEFFQTRTFKLLVSHTEKQITDAFIEADLILEGSKKALQVGNDVEAAIIAMKQKSSQERADAEALQ